MKKYSALKVRVSRYEKSSIKFLRKLFRVRENKTLDKQEKMYRWRARYLCEVSIQFI